MFNILLAQVYGEFVKNVKKNNEDNQDLRIEFLYQRFEALCNDLDDTDHEPELDQDGMYLYFMFIHSLISMDSDQEIFAFEA